MDEIDTYPVLVGDFGGTNARTYLHRYAAHTRPACAAIAISGAVSRGPIKVTNSHWVLERDAFARHIGSSSIEVFNDFEAVALVLPHLEDYLRAISTAVITAPNPGLQGLARAAARAWR